MNGAECLMTVSKEAGIDVCFANPGTTEMPMVMALDSAPGIRPVLALHENVCSGAADGYARLAGKPAMVMTHLGPGFANSVANQHNARRAFQPIFNVIGEHATWHLPADAPLTMDIDSLAGTCSAWVRRTSSVASVPTDIAEGIAAARGGRGRIATLIFHHDHQVAEVSGKPALPKFEALGAVNASLVLAAAKALKSGRKTCLFLGGTGLSERGLAAAGKIAAATGCELVAETQISLMEAGAGRPAVQRMPYFPDQGRDFLAPFEHVILVGAKSPVAFFGYEGLPSIYLDGHAGLITLAGQTDDAAAALEGLVDELGCAGAKVKLAGYEPGATPTGRLDAEKLGRVVAALQPEDAVMVVTAVTTGRVYNPFSAFARPHTQLGLCGGAIGEGPALAAGAAIAAPGRKVINIQADGSGAYIPQAFWTQAREGLDVVTVICSNRRYAILQVEMQRAGLNQPGANAASLTQLSNPDLDWPSISRGFGVPGVTVETAEDLARELSRALAEPGPRLIEAVI